MNLWLIIPVIHFLIRLAFRGEKMAAINLNSVRGRRMGTRPQREDCFNRSTL